MGRADEDGKSLGFDNVVPIGGEIPWNKSPAWGILSSGSADTNTVNKLIDTGADFEADGVSAGDIVQNTTDGTFGIVDVVDGPTSLTLRADTQAGSVVTDVFPLGTEAYEVYLIKELGTGWVEVNALTISNSESRMDGKTIEDINNSTPSIPRGNNTSGGTVTELTSDEKLAFHTHDYTDVGSSGSNNRTTENNNATLAHTHDTSVNIHNRVWIMRIK